MNLVVYKMARKYGFEWLESDTEIYNLLIDKQERGDEILNLFSIQMMNDSYQNRDAEEVNRIYVIRDEMSSDSTPTNFDGDGYNTLVQIIISTSHYDIVKAQALLKTCVKTIDGYIQLEPIRKYCRIRNITPKYVEPGRLTEYRIELLCYEINEKNVSPDFNENALLSLRIKADINGDYPIEKYYPVSKIRYNKIKKPVIEDDFTFGGG